MHPALRAGGEERVEALVAEEHVELLPSVQVPHGARGERGGVLEPRRLAFEGEGVREVASGARGASAEAAHARAALREDELRGAAGVPSAFRRLIGGRREGEERRDGRAYCE